MTCSVRRPRAERWLRRLTSTVSATAGAALLATAVTVPAAQRPEPRDPGGRLQPVALVTAGHRWPGHPGRTLVRYRVHRGDTATGLAVRFHAWTRELLALNHLGRYSRLYVGTRLRIPVVDAAAHRHHRARHHARHHRARHHARHRRARHHARAHHARAHRHHHHHTRRHHHARHHHARHHHARHHHARHHHARHHPWRHAGAGRAQVRRLVVRAAHRHHVAPSLALAIAWQESGWQQNRLSSAGAVGVMQVLPSTGRWMSLYVRHRLNVYALGDNITAGVVLVRLLRGETSLRRAVGAYYQGLGSVRRYGLYPSTRHYVRNVLALHRRLRHGWRPA